MVFVARGAIEGLRAFKLRDSDHRAAREGLGEIRFVWSAKATRGINSGWSLAASTSDVRT